MNPEQMRIEFEDWWEQFKSEHDEWMWADREALLFQAWKAGLRASKVQELEAKYNELIMAVARKFPNETRHQTALRYINEAELAEQDYKPDGVLKGK